MIVNKAFKTLSLLSVFLCIICINFNKVWASQEEVLDVVVSGNERTDEQTILSYIDLESFKKNPTKLIQSATKKLHETDLFSAVKIYKKNQQLIVNVVENPLISEVKFVGNKKVNDESLQSEVSLKKRSVFSKTKLQNDLKRINEIYIKTGRFLAKIDPKVIQKDQNRIDIIFEISEGEKAKISEIYFVGNVAFSDRELSEEISTKKSKWWKFLSSSDSYDSDRIEYDKEMLRRFYGNNGYADFSVLSSTAQINKQKDSFFITFLVEEGIRYNVGNVDIVNNIDKLDSEILHKKILIKKGKIFNAELVDKTVDEMVEVLSEKSYAFAQVEPVLKRNRAEKIIDIDFVIHETPRIYINQINISGNTRTLDEVIRRELRLREGDPYNVTKINRSKQRIENLGFFEKVDFNTKRVGDSDKINLEIEVKEKKTGELNLGLGYSTVNRATINAGIRENNLFGTGRQLSFNIQKSFAALNAEVGYTKPYFLGRPVDVGFDIFKFSTTKRNTIAFDQTNNGFNLNASYSITEFLSHNITYSYSEQIVGSVAETASFYIKSLQGNFIVSGMGNNFFYDKRNNRIDPKNGYFLSVTQTFNGLGGNIKNLKYEGSAGYYTPTFSNDYILKFLVRGGVINGIGQDVKTNNSFFLGGNDFRGFQYAGLGPRTQINGFPSKNGDAVGGKIFYVATAEFRFPLGLPRELGINGILFSDNGVLKGFDRSALRGTVISDSGALRSSYGVSIAWSSPMGPIRLDFARILHREVFDRVQTFNFTVGTSF